MAENIYTDPELLKTDLQPLIDALVSMIQRRTGYDARDLLLDYVDLLCEKGTTFSYAKAFLKEKAYDYLKYCNE